MSYQNVNVFDNFVAIYFLFYVWLGYVKVDKVSMRLGQQKK